MRPIEPTVLGELYRRHAPALRLYARQWNCGGDDLVQNAFMRLAQQASPPEQVLPWLYRVVRNEALTAQRAAARRRRREERAGSPESWFDATENRLDADEVAGWLAELPLELREVIVAKVWGGLTFEEIAALVGCSPPTTHRRYHTGLAQLRERLNEPWKRTPTARTT
jgi:RNA polymerase sigma-70 factor (ECF subfamily)